MSSNTARWQWEPKHANAFQEIKRIIAKETILAFPDFSQAFHIYTDAKRKAFSIL